MASQWRIRHKLMLGLGLIVAVIALLLGGAANGLISYYLTIYNVRAKSNELIAAEELKAAFHELMDPYLLPRLAADTTEFEKRVVNARNKLDVYDRLLNDSQENDAETESARFSLGRLRAEIDNPGEQGKARGGRFQQSLAAVAQKNSPSNSTFGAHPSLSITASADERIRKEMQATVNATKSLVDDLHSSIKVQLERSLKNTKHYYQIAIWIILPASVMGLSALAGLLYYFYDWILHPIRDLEAGVQRVARGDFGHRISISSGDEMQDLAAAFNDMTQRLDDLYKDLARQVNERSRQLVRSERLASVGFLAAGVAHEINNPLASIAFCSEALESRLHDLLGRLPNGEQKEVFVKYLKMIQDEAFRCKNITERLLTFSRSGERKREPVDLGVVVQSVLDITQHLQNSRGKQIAFETNGDRAAAGRILAPVNADEIKSVILNLVVNALDSMDEGGKLTIRLGQREEQAYLEFADTGCGMTQDVLDNIFEPFFTRSRTGKGTGLGLTISHRIVNQHGGDIEAASAGPGQGSTFTIRLPLQVADAAGTSGGQELRRAA